MEPAHYSLHEIFASSPPITWANFITREILGSFSPFCVSVQVRGLKLLRSERENSSHALSRMAKKKGSQQFEEFWRGMEHET